MADVLITGFKSDEEAKEFITWFEEQGEQSTDYWFEVVASELIRDGIYCNIKKTYPLQKNARGEYVMDVSESD